MTKQNKISREVLTVAGMRKLLQQGWELHVVCSEEPNVSNTHVRGGWYCVAVDPATREWGVLVSQKDAARERKRAEALQRALDPSDIAYREIKTNNGLFNLQRELGITACVSPGTKGEVMVTGLSKGR